MQDARFSEEPRVAPTGLIVVIPTLNEALNVGPLIQALDRARRGLAFDVLVVDDNSADGTSRLVTAAKATRPWLHVITRHSSSGLGSAYRAGFEWARQRHYRFIAEMDADLSHDPADLPRLYTGAVDGADLVLGSRYVAGGATVGWPLHRRLLSRAANFYARTLLRLDVNDVTGGFRIYSRRSIEFLLDGAGQCEGYGFQVEGVHCVARSGLRISEIPIVFRERIRGSSKMSGTTIVEAALRCLTLATISRDRGQSRIDRRATAEEAPAVHADAYAEVA